MVENLLLCAPLAQVHHRLAQLLLADAPVVVAVEHPERGLHVVHLVAAVLEDLLPHPQEVRPVHHPVPVAISLHSTWQCEGGRGQNLRIPGQRAALGRHAGHGPVLQPTIRTRRLLSHIHHSLVFEMFEKVKQTLIEPPDRPFHASSRKVFGAKYFASKVSLFRPKLTRELVSREI